MTKGLLSSICAVPLLLIAACDQPAPPPASEGVRVDAAVAALVNGEPIYVMDVELEATVQGLIEPGDVLEPGDDHYDSVLEQLVDQKLLAQEALRRQLELDDVARHRLQSARERILGNVLIETLVSEEVGDAEIRRMYEEQIELKELGEEVLIRHILLDSRARANEILARLQAGEDFEKMAYDHSIDRNTFLEGGRLGYRVPGDLPSPFADVIADTAIGALSDPFESAMGWHILKVEDRRAETPPTLEEMRPELVRFMTMSEIAKTLRRLRARADVIKDGKALEPVMDDPFEDLPEEAPSPSEPEEPASAEPTAAPLEDAATEPEADAPEAIDAPADDADGLSVIQPVPDN